MESFAESSSVYRHTYYFSEDVHQVKRSPVCCWKIRERMCDIDWFVAVENLEEMMHFAGALEGMIEGRMVSIAGCTSKWNDHTYMVEVARNKTVFFCLSVEDL